MNAVKTFVKRMATLFVVVTVMLNASGGAFASETAEAGAVSPEEKAELVREVIEHLSIYARYDEVYQEKLYKEGLLSAIEKYPEIYEDVMEAILTSVDEHSEYYNSEETALLMEQVTGTVVGIGITFRMHTDGVEVVSVIPDTPASNTGIKVGDVIVSADETELKGMDSETAASYIKGAEGSSVKIGIKREGESSLLYLDMIRQSIIGTSVEGSVVGDNDDIMYIRVYGFVSNTAEMFKAELDKATQLGITNIIIDLRDNGGGIFEQAIQMADYLVPKGSLITTEDHKISLLNKTYYATSEDTQNFDAVVLLNGNSASASEVLAAALSENDCAYIIGRKSYGKGTIQTIMNLPFDDSMKYTVGYYLTPKGNNINGVGISPDTYVENSVSNFDMTPYKEYGYVQVYDIGDCGEEIELTKQLLSVWGSYSGETNDVYDEELFNAVYRFQQQTGLYPYGVLDYTTQHELYNRIKLSKVVNDDQLDAAIEYFRTE